MLTLVFFPQKIKARDNVESTFPLAEVQWNVPPNTEILKGATQYRTETQAKTTLYLAVSCYGFTAKNQLTHNPKIDLVNLLVSAKLASSHFGGPESREGGDIEQTDQWYDGLGLYSNPVSFLKLLQKRAFRDFVQMVKEKLAIARQEKLLRTFAPSTSLVRMGTGAAPDQTFDTGSYFEGGETVRVSRGIKRKKEQVFAYSTKSAKNKKTAGPKHRQRIVSDDEEDEDNADRAAAGAGAEEEEEEENETEEAGEEEEEEEEEEDGGQRGGEEEQEEGSVDSVEEVSVRRQTKKAAKSAGVVAAVAPLTSADTQQHE